MRYLRTAVRLAAVSACLTPTLASAHGKQRPRACHGREPMGCLAARHGWNAGQVADEWAVLWRESRSTPGHLDLTATNGYCYGSGQLNGGPSEYYRYGGNPYTVVGQEMADLNYVAGRYGSPAVAWQHEESYGWY